MTLDKPPETSKTGEMLEKPPDSVKLVREFARKNDHVTINAILKNSRGWMRPYNEVTLMHSNYNKFNVIAKFKKRD